MNLQISSSHLSSEQLKPLLEAHLQAEPSISLLLRSPTTRFRDPNAAILVAVIAGSSGALGALIAGIFAIARESRSHRLVLQGKDGRRIECRSDLSTERIEELIELAKKLDEPSIHF
jgi:hypothetical protein